MKCVRNYKVSVRPRFHCQNRETHGETVRLDRCVHYDMKIL